MPFKTFFFGRDRTFPVKVSTLDAQVEFNLPVKAYGRELFDLVARAIGLRETWFFGLQYLDDKGNLVWLRDDRRVLDQYIPKEYPLCFNFMVKFYPEDVSEELIQEVTQHLFFLQVKQLILGMNIYCQPEVAILLASYYIQATYGDFDKGDADLISVSLEELLPLRVMNQYQMTARMWKDRVKVWYADHKGLTKDEAEMEYLKIAQDLGMYGISFFEITNKKGTMLWLGVSAVGLHVFENVNKLSPKISFPWSEIRNISVDGKRFNIRASDKTSPNFIFFSPNSRMNKVLLDLCIGNHELYKKRRKPDTIEVQQMKEAAKELKLRRQAEKEKLMREIQLKEEVMEEKTFLLSQMKKYEDQLKVGHEALRKSEEASEILLEKSMLTENETALLSQKAREAEQEARRIKMLSTKAQEEKMLLEQQARHAEELVKQMVEEGEKRAREAQYLKEELIRARLSEKQAKERLHAVLNATSLSTENLLNMTTPELGQSVYSKVGPLNLTCPGQGQPTPYAQSLGHSSGSSDIPLPNISPSLDLPDLMLDSADPDLTNLDLLADTDVEQISMEIEKERVEYLEKSRYLQTQLRNLKSEMEVLKVEDSQTILDAIYEDQHRLGETKYSTLKRTRSGNTKSRVAYFDQL